ncbi:hypothetical protein B0A55_00049 [Friedmanniomyces simplex]|uniref:Uncharacterized protein n=1 Tax=Friedmanniomyces simplex TaxID=329884 RepID=A0A4U0Y659_9PEZI|nr:hypothetical protein B0A55_00049 [Friedmanniomyces simplex]
MKRKLEFLRAVCNTHTDEHWDSEVLDDFWGFIEREKPGVRGTRYEYEDLEQLMFDEYEIWYREHYVAGEKIRKGHGNASGYHAYMKRWHGLAGDREEYVELQHKPSESAEGEPHAGTASSRQGSQEDIAADSSKRITRCLMYSRPRTIAFWFNRQA